jgi:hypothetical protein
MVCCLQALAHCAIRRLPRRIRRGAEMEIRVMLSVAKWAGIGCYLVWTAKDVLAEVGVQFVT